jgi:hypothetical protein
LVRVEGQVRGELAVQELGNLDESGKRTIEGESCSEVVDALALFAALSVDPDARTSRLPDPPPEARTEPRFEPPPAPPFAPPAAREKKPEPPRHESVFRSLAGAHAGVVGAGVPAWLFMFAPFVEGRLERSGPPRAFSPALRLSFSKLDAETAVTSQGTADLDLMTVRADACPVTIGVMRAVAARPCLTASAGRLSAVGNTDHPRRVALSWWSAGALFRAEWSVAGLLQIEAATGLDLPIRRDAFYFQPSTPIYTVPRALGFASAGAGFWFW